jgi:hypothetical protein
MMETNDLPENPEKKPFESIRDAVEASRADDTTVFRHR